MTPKTARQGFTLLELMITIAIIAILAVIAFPSYETFMQRTRMDNARATMSDVIQYMERHYANNSTFCAGNGISTSGSCANRPDIGSITTNANDRYDVRFHSVLPNRYIIIGIPDKAADANSSTPLNLLYDSLTATFAKCTAAGLNAANSSNSDPGNACEVL